MRFKVGDRVRMIAGFGEKEKNSSPPICVIGQQGPITKVSKKEGFPIYYVRINGKWTMQFIEEELRLVCEAKAWDKEAI